MVGMKSTWSFIIMPTWWSFYYIWMRNHKIVLDDQARSTEVAQYLGEVPAFRSAISDPAFLRKDSWTRPHGLVWPLLLQAGMLRTEPAFPVYFSEAEYMLVNDLNQTCDLAKNNSLTNNPSVLTVSREIYILIGPPLKKGICICACILVCKFHCLH